MAIPITPLINGKSYDWADITVNILGLPVVGITGVEYAENQTIENVYGAGKYPVSRGFGKVEPTAKITMLMEEVEALQAAVTTGRLQDIPEFDILITYVDVQLVTRVHKLRNARFMKNDRIVAQGDTSIPVELDLVISHVEWR